MQLLFSWHRIILPKQFCHPHTTTVVLFQYKPYSACKQTAPITMVNQPNADATILPPPSASATPIGLLNDSSFSHTCVANRETKGAKGSFKFTFFISFCFCPYPSPLATLIQSANIACPKHSTKTDNPILVPKAIPLKISSKLIPAFPLLFSQLSSFQHGMQESAVPAHTITAQSKTPSPKPMAYYTTLWLVPTNASLHSKTNLQRKAASVAILHLLLTRQALCCYLDLSMSSIHHSTLCILHLS